jgi:hypothetical protein
MLLASLFIFIELFAKL